MARLDGRLVVTSLDLVAAGHCAVLPSLDRVAADGGPAAPTLDLRFDSMRTVAPGGPIPPVLLDGARRVVTVAPPGPGVRGLEAAQGATLAAFHAGAEAVVGGVLLDEPAPGVLHAVRPDLLRRTTAGAIDVVHTGRARYVPAALLEALVIDCHVAAALLGSSPGRTHAVLADGTTTTRDATGAADRVAALRALLLKALALEPPVAPDVVPHCTLCRWAPRCDGGRESADSVALVPGVDAATAVALRARGLATVEAIATAEDINEVLRRQAALVVEHRVGGHVAYDLLPPSPGTGLARLPDASEGDCFVAVDVGPFAGPAEDGGDLVVLVGVGEVVDGVPSYTALWAHDTDAEGKLAQRLGELLGHRRLLDPHLHVYVHGEAAVAGLRALATTHPGVLGDLAGDLLVDLGAAVTEALAVSTGTDALSDLEPLWTVRRSGRPRATVPARLRYERWLEVDDDTALRDLEDANATACDTTKRLRDWLESRRPEVRRRFGVAPGRPQAAQR